MIIAIQCLDGITGAIARAFEGYGLTYKSCQDSGKLHGLCRHLAAEMGTEEATIRAALNRVELPDGETIHGKSVPSRAIGRND